eukprot:symbB.v1.2.036869.t1/scaffold5310.1/size28534/1
MNLPEKRKENRAKEIISGAQYLQRTSRFPSSRSCQDLPWAILFILTGVALFAFANYAMDAVSTDINKELNDPSFYHHKTLDDHIGIWNDAAIFNLACEAGCVTGLIVAFLWVMTAKACPKPVVYISLYAVPVCLLLCGVIMVLWGFKSVASEEEGSANSALIGGGVVAILLGLCQLSCVMCCWARYIPFTIEVVGMVADVSNENPCMIFVSLMGGFLGAAWLVLLAGGFAAFTIQHPQDTADQNKGMLSPLEFAFFLLLFWGSGVIHNVCHTAYCGVFSRWYFSEEGPFLLPSLRVALGSSFGSICFGTFMVAAINALEMLIRSLRVAFQEDGNIVGCIIALILECIVSAIGDMLEYFNSWVYVQCAIRGGSFCESARASCAMIACNGIKGIIGDLLINSVVSLGAWLSGLCGLAVGALIAIAFTRAEIESSTSAVVASGLLGGLLGGLLTGGAVMSIFSSGAKAIIMCWAEDPNPMHEEHEFEDLHTEMNAKIREYQ